MPPLVKDNFDLSPREFRAGLAMRYMKPLQELLPKCDRCGALFTVGHALDCRKGGLVVQRHNEVRDTIYDLAVIAWHKTTKEPVIGESSENFSGALLRADIGVRGVWQTQMTALFDMRVIDTDAKSYIAHTPQSVLENAKKE